MEMPKNNMTMTLMVKWSWIIGGSFTLVVSWLNSWMALWSFLKENLLSMAIIGRISLLHLRTRFSLRKSLILLMSRKRLSRELEFENLRQKKKKNITKSSMTRKKLELDHSWWVISLNCSFLRSNSNGLMGSSRSKQENTNWLAASTRSKSELRDIWFAEAKEWIEALLRCVSWN